MVTAADPVLVSVTVWVPLPPRFVLPKLILVGAAPSRVVMPVPDRVITAGELVALLTTETPPVMLPVVVGAKVALIVMLWPAASVNGRDSPLMLKPVPVTVA